MFRSERTKVFSSIAWPGHGWSGALQYGIIASVFNTKPRWVEQVELT